MGLYTAAVLAELEAHTGKPILSHFDLVAGTSVGGIIALGLARGTSAAAIRDAFVANGPKIFSAKPPPRRSLSKKMALIANATHAKYSPQSLRETIVSIVGESARISDLSTRTIIPSVNLTKGKPQVFKTSHHPTFSRDCKLKIVDVALATSAAPTFFPLHRIGGEMFADGGMYANAPDHLALHEAEHFLEQNREDVSILSVGTTSASFSFSSATNLDLGWMGWMDDQRLPTVMIAAQQLNTDYMLGHVLGDRYLRIDQTQSRAQQEGISLDVATEFAIHDLLGLAEASVREHLGKASLPRFLAHNSTMPTFFHNPGSK
jgi:patatin-like phospholipase/acyl hydrolase